MKLLDRIKEWMGIRRLLRDLPQDRKPIARNLALARKVAIVYVVEDEAAHNQVRNYVKRIKEELGISNIMAWASPIRK
jgi:predicted TIM-barrel fold metal-dependent hydrolase